MGRAGAAGAASLVFPLCALGCFGAAPAAEVPLLPGRSVTGTLVTASRCYPVHLSLGSPVRFSLSQVSGDLALEISDPSGRSLIRIDEWEYGVETATLVPAVSGGFRACVSAVGKSPDPLRYALLFEPAGAPPSEVETRGRAERAASEAKKLAAGAKDADLRQAVETNREALALFRRLGDNSAEVLTLIKLGDALNGLGQYAPARAAYAEALAKCPPDDLRAQAEALADSALSSSRLGEPEAALESLDGSLRIFERIGQPLSEATVRNNLGMLWLRTGEFQPALDSLLAALPGMKRKGRASEGLALNNIALAYRMLGDYVRAEDYLRRALPLLAPPASPTDRGKALMNLGRLRALEGDLTGAMPYLTQASALLKDSPDATARGDIENNLGQLLYRQGDPNGSLEHLARAQEIYQPGHSAVGLASADHFSGLALAGLGRTDEALEQFQSALQIRLSARLLDDSADTLVAIARIQRSRGDTAGARASLERAIQIGDELRVRVAGADLRASYFTSKQPAYQEAIDLLLQPLDQGASGDGAAQALALEERSRSRSLLEGLASRRHDILSGTAGEWLADEQRVVRTIGFKSQQLAQLPSPPEAAAQRAALLKDVEELQTEYDRLEGVLAERNPRQAAVAKAPPLGLEGIRDVLDSETILLEFALGPERSYLWVVSKSELACFHLPGASSIEPLARQVASLAGARAARLAQPAQDRRFRSAAAELSRVLFADAAPMLLGKRLLLAPDGVLHNVPFAVLPAPGEPGTPLGIAYELVNVPSASVLGALRSHPVERPPGALRVAVFADPVFKGDPRLPEPTRGTSSLSSLPFSVREADSIQDAARAANVTRLTGFAASKQALAQPQVRTADILHIASHATIDDTRPELSGIYFSEADSNGKPRDGMLGLYEVYDLNLPVQLAVLSGCQTGLGKGAGGDGLVGLSRAFFFAGASRILVSLWEISDEGTALFMREFYRRLVSNGLAPAAALREARKTLYGEPRWRDPSYWAGFVLEGEWRPLTLNEAGR